MTTRRHISTTARVRIFERTGGVCHLCGGRIHAGEQWDAEHPTALAMGGSDKEEDLRPAHAKCHRPKTAQDIADIARAKRREARHIGAKAPSRNPLPGSRASGIRKRFNGTVEKW